MGSGVKINKVGEKRDFDLIRYCLEWRGLYDWPYVGGVFGSGAAYAGLIAVSEAKLLEEVDRFNFGFWGVGHDPTPV